ncbi:MAG: GNAT family N-acetyltransferase [Chitinophagaceae bacterium]
MPNNVTIMPAKEKDVSEITHLVNGAYRGESSKKGWTTEADLLDGQRTDEEAIRLMLQKENSTLLVCKNELSKVVGCVCLEKQGSAMYLGMLTVSPSLQGAGLGKFILMKAEEYAVDKKATSIIMTVLTVRQELIDWYVRRGYKKTEEKKPFPEDSRFGIPKQFLEFVVLVKNIAEKK